MLVCTARVQSGTVSRSEFARAMGILGVQDLGVVEELFDSMDAE